MEVLSNPNGSLFKLSKDEYEFILDIIRELNPINTNMTSEKYTRDNFLSEVFMGKDRYDELVSMLKRKKNIILQGAPGVGKTFTAKRLAYSMMGEKDESRIAFVQFHQNYSYEDFIMGYRPEGSNFKLKEGIFYNFCKKASNNPDKEFFFIIDEINRGNLSKIFGELLMLIEADYREEKATLAYSGKSFSVPKNLYIIGMMNTADRSLALIDYALRRRFSFMEIDPGFDSDGFKQYMSTFNNTKFNSLIEQIKELNNKITDDPSLGRGFRIGHSYFCERNCVEHLSDIVKYDIIPMLEEYWFDDSEKVKYWKDRLSGVFNDK
ncbi:AAA family ATPase [Succinivibrio sp. AGMB01872]|uniref:AAA family ATPase n=2 Tax=Succinivibrio faecicola TaxID=2820300 RepID=A0ABS7DHM6_9GAMM|nr:AAA family ATPase [Succinivibrio faecicola]